MMVNFIVASLALLALSGSVLLSNGQDIPIIQGPNAQVPKESSTQAPQTQSSEVSCKDFKEECEGCVENANLCDYHYKCQDPQYAENDYWCMSLTMLDGLPKYCESCKTIEPGCKNVTEENCPALAANFQKGGIWQNIIPGGGNGKGKCKKNREPCQSDTDCCDKEKGASCDDPNYDPSKGGPQNKVCIVFVAEENSKPNNGQGGNGNGNGSPFPFPARPTCNSDTCSADDKTCCNGKYCAVPKTVEEKYECKRCSLALGSVCFLKPESSMQCCGNRIRPSTCAMLDPNNDTNGMCVECPMYNRQNKNAPCVTDNNCCSSDSKEPTKYECRSSEKEPNKKTCVKCVKENQSCEPNGTPCCFYPVGTACMKNFSGQGYSCQFSREQENNVNSTTVPKS